MQKINISTLTTNRIATVTLKKIIYAEEDVFYMQLEEIKMKLIKKE